MKPFRHSLFFLLLFRFKTSTNFVQFFVLSFDIYHSNCLIQSRKINDQWFIKYIGRHRRWDIVRDRRSGCYSSHCSDIVEDQSLDRPGTTITVSYAGQACNITVGSNESILSALERQSTYIQSHLTNLPDLPSDCRRGNCLTCAASLIWPPRTDSNQILHTLDDGLSPAMSELMVEKGYILTCSSFLPPSAPVLRLELGVQDDVWKDVYRDRFTTPETQLAARSAMARVLRQSAESNLPEWMRSTEEVLRQTE